MKPEVMVKYLREVADRQYPAAGIVSNEIADWIEQNNAVVEGLREEPAELAALREKLAAAERERDEARAALSLSGSGGNRPTHFQGERVEAWLDATKWAEHRTDAQGTKAIVALAERYDEVRNEMRNEMRAALNQIDRMLATPPTVYTVDIEAAVSEWIGETVLNEAAEQSLLAVLRKHARPADAEALLRLFLDTPGGGEDGCRAGIHAVLSHMGLALAAKPAPWKPRPGRCDICDWTLAESRDKGCVPGDCSYRPEQGSPEWYRIKARQEEIERQLSSTAPNSIGAGFVPDFGAIGAAFLKGMGDWTDGARAAFAEIERQRAEGGAS